MNETLTNFWNSFVGEEVPPIAHELKSTFSERWVRFHSLPESKRYPETKGEYEEVLFRHNTVIEELAGVPSSLFVVVPEYSELSIPGGPERDLDGLFPGLEYWATIDQNEECGVYWHLHAAKIEYKGSEFNRIFRKVANNEAGNILIVSPAANFVFHPYDGGGDFILSSLQERDILKGKYKKWLSANPEGL